MSDKNENWLFTIHFTTSNSISLCHARLSRYCRPSSFWCRIKCPCKHRNSGISSFKRYHTPCNIYPAIECTQKRRFSYSFQSQPCISPFTSHFNVLFIINMCDERQNVVVKSNILTMFPYLKPPTIFISTLDLLISINIWQFVQG